MSTPENNPETKPANFDDNRAFFGRRLGKRLHAGQRDLMKSLLPQIQIHIQTGPQSESKTLVPSAPFKKQDAPTILEIGYGGGEHLARQALQNPNTNFIGAEVFTGGIGKMLEKIEQDSIENVRLYTQDAYPLLQDMGENSLDGAYLLYPDPWPKKRHNKRRFVSERTLNELARTIKPGGFFRFASDIEDYANWTLSHIMRHDKIHLPLVDPLSWHTPFEGWEPTRYEKKARREDRMKSWYFTFQIL